MSRTGSMHTKAKKLLQNLSGSKHKETT